MGNICNFIINEEHYIYVGDMHLRYVLFVEHVMLPIIMGQLHGETNPSLIYILEEIIEKEYIYIYIYIIMKNIKNNRKIIFVYERKTLYIGGEDQR